MKVGSALLVDGATGKLNAEWLASLADDIAELAEEGPAGAGRLLRRDRARPPRARPEERRAEARGRAGRGGGRAGGARRRLGEMPRGARPDRGADPPHLGRHRAAPPLSERPRHARDAPEDAAPCPSSTRTTRWRRPRSATATTTASPRASRRWSAPIASCFSPISTGSTPRRRRSIPSAAFIDFVPAITPAIEAMAGSAGSELSRGGMKTKIEAGKIATAAGAAMVIASGRQKTSARRDRCGRARHLVRAAGDAGLGAQGLDRQPSRAARHDHRRCRRGGRAEVRQEPAACRRHRRVGRFFARRRGGHPRRERASRSAAASSPSTSTTRRRSSASAPATSKRCSAIAAAPR